MFLCYFSLSSSMSANLYDQTKEIGILRALGFTRVRIVLLFVYEAFILVIASSLIGVLVGTIAAFTMVFQFSAFVDSPPIIFFPSIQIIIIFAAAFLYALMATIGPTSQIVKNRIASILKSA